MQAPLSIDATIARPPFSGVQYAVIAEAEAVRAFRQDCSIYGFHPACTRRPPFFASRVAGRILWQQALLPRILRRDGSVLLSLGYTCPVNCRTPIILQVHDIIALEHPELCSSLNALHIRTLLPPSIRRADRIIVSTDHVRRGIVAHFPEAAGKIHVVPLGVDHARFASAMPSPAQGRPYILFVGNIEPKKGLDVLLDAYSLAAESIGADLMLAGRIAWKSTAVTSRLRSWQGPGRIAAPGRIQDKDLPGVYASASAFVFPSREEGFGMPVLEAMAAGVPVVHSDHPAIMEAAGGAGLPFRNGDAADLAEKLKTLFASIQLQNELRHAGRARAMSCTWGKFAESALEISSDLN